MTWTYHESVSMKRVGVRRRLILAAVTLPIVLVTCLVIGFTVPPAARTAELPQSITVDGIAYERVHLITMKTNRRDSVAVQVPAASRSILVRASCRLAVLHASSAVSALALGMTWTRTGGDNIPDTQGNDYLVCARGPRSRLMQTIEPAWLPRNEDQLHLAWSELPTFADTPSDSPASWALAVYLPE